MGQYYRFINLDKKEKCDKNIYGLKLMEHSYLENDYCNDILYLLSDEWKGDRIIHVGDYASVDDSSNTKDVIKGLDKEFNPKESFYNYSYFFNEVSPNKVDKKIRYVYNLDKEEYIDLYHQPIVDYWYNNGTMTFAKINSFALLTACGNGQGGGDYFGKNDNFVGYWAGDHFVSSDKKIEKYNDFAENDITFCENILIKNLLTYDDYNRCVISESMDCVYDLIEMLRKNDLMTSKIKVDVSNLTEREYDVLKRKNIKELKIPKVKRSDLCKLN